MRYPAVAGRFYPNDKRTLNDEIRKCFTHPIGPGLPEGCSEERKIVSVIAPHAGYMASGMNAAHAYKRIAEDGLPDVYIVIGPDHYGIPYDVAMCGEPYVTPLGVCGVHKEMINILKGAIPDDPYSHKFEHSVEVHVPFIQYIDPDPFIVPIIMGDQSRECVEYLVKAITEACEGLDALVIASSDMSHYVPKEQAYSEGKEVLEKVCACDVPGMYDVIEKRRITACGYGPMAVAMSLGRPAGELLRYSDSQDSLGPHDGGAVGYASVAFFR